MRAVIQKARSRRNIRIWQNSFTIDLITHEGECRGVLVWDRRRGFALVWARSVVLATGGAGQLYRGKRPIRRSPQRMDTPWPIALGAEKSATWNSCNSIPYRPLHRRLGSSSLDRGPCSDEGAYLRDRHGERFLAGPSSAGRAGHPETSSRGRFPLKMAKTQHPNVYTSTCPTSMRPTSAAAFPASSGCAVTSTSTSPATAFPCAPESSLHDRRRRRRSPRTNDAARALGGRRGYKLRASRGKSPGFEQFARGARLRRQRGRRYRWRARRGRTSAALGTPLLASNAQRRSSPYRPRRSAGITPGAPLAAIGDPAGTGWADGSRRAWTIGAVIFCPWNLTTHQDGPSKICCLSRG